MALGEIQRANLNLFWIREAITVRGISGGLKELVRHAREAVRRSPLEEMTPWNVGEDVGTGTEIRILDKSIDPG